jgi:hypothetical protein
MTKTTYLRPSEIVEEFKNVPFNISELGILLKLKLVKGYHKNQKTEICVKSVFDLIEYRNKLIETDIVIL